LLTITIKENSLLAKLAASYMKADKLAIVFGRTIHLHNTKRQELLTNRKWLRHEVAHVHQWMKCGSIRFLFYYLLETFNKGYYNNRFEVDARSKENDKHILEDVQFV
jgi:hypothetical protein